MAHLSEAALSQINQIIDKYIDEPSPLMMILSAIQKDFGYIPLEVQEIVSQRTGLSVAEIYGVVTFYSFFSLTPKGKYVIGCCLGTACYVKGAQQIIAEVPEAEIIKYATDLKAMTQASGRFSRKFLRYEEVPEMLIKKIVDEYKKEQK